MPLTPLHLGFSMPAFMLNKHKLHFLCLCLGSMIPDLEIIPMIPFSSDLLHARGSMHSILGALTFDVLVVLFIVLFIAPPFGRWLKRHGKGKWCLFAGVDVTKPPTDLFWALGSALIGTMSHTSMDLFTHEYNPIFWPDTSGEINWMFFGDRTTMYFIVALPLFIIVIAMLWLFWARPAKSKKRIR
jgi:membrane-bound metal-dependent hydrolase YbcI (DUF457 family)